MVLAQFFEHFDDEAEEPRPPAQNPSPNFTPHLNPNVPPDLDGLDLPGLDDNGLPPQSADGGSDLNLSQVPFDPAERPRLLAELYERLEAAKSETMAQPIMEAIENLWAVSGSDTVDLLMSRAAQFAKDAEIDLSLAVLDAVVDIAPDEAEAWYLRAKVNVLKGKPERALTDLRRALNLDAKHYRAIADLGLLLEQLGAKKEALEAYRRALAVNPFLEDARLGVEALAREVEGQDI